MNRMADPMLQDVTVTLSEDTPSRWVWAASRGAVPGGASAGRALARRSVRSPAEAAGAGAGAGPVAAKGYDLCKKIFSTHWYIPEKPLSTSLLTHSPWHSPLRQKVHAASRSRTS